MSKDVHHGYPHSYYAATRNLDLTFPVLASNINADVCVVGGGFSGLATTLFLRESGLDVVLLESNLIGWGASGRNGGQVVAGYGEDTEEVVSRVHGSSAGHRAYALGFATIDLLKTVIDRYEIECDLTWGYTRAAITGRQVDYLRSIVKDLEQRKPDILGDLFEGANVERLVGSSAYRAALHTKGEGHLHPLNLALGEANAIQGLGGQIFEQSTVTGIEHSANGKAATVKTVGGQVRADTLVLCGNAYLEKLEPRLQQTLIPGYSAIIATEPLAANVRARLIPHNAAVSDMRSVLDYYRFSADGRMLWGGLGHWSGADSANPEPLLRKRMTKIFPELAQVRIAYQWSGRIGISANLNPQIGRLAPNVYYAQAYSGHGVASTHLSGRMIADAITGQSDDFEMFASIGHQRIPNFDLIHKLARAWGMNSRRVIEWF
ncbi:MAG: FAD-binding oxidoreductase [Gammaproteobacteria bacterium]|nr:FAD-binding oxidoreductase [Gammaproteobacteria bacterium]